MTFAVSRAYLASSAAKMEVIRHRIADWPATGIAPQCKNSGGGTHRGREQFLNRR
jgi:hypothetical protein